MHICMRKVLLFAESHRLSSYCSHKNDKWANGCALEAYVERQQRALIATKYVNKMSMTLSALQCVCMCSLSLFICRKNGMAFSILYCEHEVCVLPQYDGSMKPFYCINKTCKC